LAGRLKVSRILGRVAGQGRPNIGACGVGRLEVGVLGADHRHVHAAGDRLVEGEQAGDIAQRAKVVT
jgi:hypothetical protein